MNLVFTQILVIFLYVITGFISGKAGLINPDQRKYLTGLCTNLILPFTIFSASSQEISNKEIARLSIALLAMFLLFGTTTVISLIYHRLRNSPLPVRAAVTSLVTYPNVTFLGLPLCYALFGEIAILYNAVATVAFNVLFFSVQFSLFTGKKFIFKNLVTPPMISTAILIIMLVFGLHLPDPLQTVASSVGSMITPMSLIIIGVMMSEHRLSAIFKEKRAYAVTAIRNLLIPAISLFLLTLIPADGMGRLCMLVYLSCPCATLSAIYAIQNDMEPELAARSVLFSTLFFAVSLPLVIFAGQKMFL